MLEFDFLQFKLSNSDARDKTKKYVTIKTNDIISIEQTPNIGKIKIFVDHYIWYVDADYDDVIKAWTGKKPLKHLLECQ